MDKFHLVRYEEKRTIVDLFKVWPLLKTMEGAMPKHKLLSFELAR